MLKSLRLNRQMGKDMPDKHYLKERQYSYINISQNRLTIEAKISVLTMYASFFSQGKVNRKLHIRAIC